MLNYCLVRFLYFLIMFIIIIIIITPILTYKVDRTIDHSRKSNERENDLRKLLGNKIPYQKSTIDNIFWKNINNNIKDIRRDSVDMAKIDEQEQQVIANDYTKNVIEEIKAYIIKIMKELNEIEKKISVSIDNNLEKNATKSLDHDKVKSNNKQNVEPKNVLKIKIHEHDVDNNNNNSTDHHKHQNGHVCNSSNNLECNTLENNSDKNYDDDVYDDDNDNSESDGNGNTTTEMDYLNIVQTIKDDTQKCKCCHQKLPPKTHNEKGHHKKNNKDKVRKDKEEEKLKEHQDKEKKVIIEDKMIDNEEKLQQSSNDENNDLTLSYSNLQENLTNDDYLWSDWSNWSVCSTSCGPGKQLRYRRCTADGQCRVKYEVDEKNCLNKSC